MKATGIVRRIDDLGRVVIPSEIRRTLRIREGDPWRFTQRRTAGVIFSKIFAHGRFAGFCGANLRIHWKKHRTDRGGVGPGLDHCLVRRAWAELVDRRNSADLENLMEQRKSYRYSPGNVKLRAVEGSEKYYLGAAAPIVAQGDLMGCVMLLMDEEETPPAEGDQKLVQTVAGFLGRQMEA